MPLLGNVKLKGDIADFDYYDWWKALVDKGISPKEAWTLDFIESSYILDFNPKRIDTSLALYHTRKHNGAINQCLQND